MSHTLITPRPYQIEGIDFLAATPRALLAFDTRLGKTLVALRAAHQVGARRILVLAPAIGRLSWAAEVPKVGPFNLFVAGPGSVPADMPTQPDLVLVLAYDALSRQDSGWAAVLAGAPKWDVLILDEAQYLKNMGSNRTQAVYGHVLHNCRRVWLLSGTPTPNHAGEMYPHYRALWPDNPPMSRHQFEDQFCVVEETPWGRRIKGSRNQAELRAKLAPFVMRRRKADVIPDLPRMAHNMVPLDMPAPTGVGEYTADALEALLSSQVNALSSDGGTSLQRLLGEAKAAPAVAWLQEQLSESIIQKVVVFAWHRTVLDMLMAGLADHEPVRIDGSTSEKAKIEAVRRFQHDPACRVFVGQMRACGTAINLDAAEDAVIVEPSWVPMDNYQAASRIENVGRRHPVSVSWLYAPRSLDARIMESLRTKTAQISALWD